MPRLRLRLALTLLAACVLPAHALVGSALQLDGQRSYVETDGPALHADRAVTVTGWFRADGSPSQRGWQALFWKGDTPDRSPYGNREIGLWLSGERHLLLASTPADSSARGALLARTGGSGIQPGRWYHFAAVVDADAGFMRVYLDGRLAAQREYPHLGIRATSGPLRLGGIPERDDFRGLLDEIRIWHRALTPAQIARDLHTPLPASTPDLVAAYTFDRLDSLGRVPDASGHGHPARLDGHARLTRVRVLAPPAAALPDSTAYAVAAQAPAPLRPIRGELADVLVDAFYSDDYGIRVNAARAIDQVAPEDLPRVLQHGLRSRHYEVRSAAAGALARLDELATVPVAGGDEMVVQGRTPEIDVAALSRARLSRADVPPRTRHFDGNAYRGWESRWQAPQPHDWHFDPEGPVLRYNRVEGLYGGWQLPRTYRRSETLTHYGNVGYGLASKALRYQAGAEVYTFYSPSLISDNLAAVGAEVHDLTDTQDGWLLPEEENSVDAFLLRRDFRDYYRRRGWSAYTAHNVGGVLQLTGRYLWDEFHSLEAEADWALLGDSPGRARFRPNPAIDAGNIRSLRADLQLDTRNRRSAPGRGWLANVLFERAGGFLGGDARYKRYLADVRRYQPLSRGARADLRLRLGTAKGRLPAQYVYDVGGYGSLRGFGYKAFSGDRMVLVNAEYWIDADRQWTSDLPADDLQLGAFLDAGAAWLAADADDPFDGLGPLLGGAADPGDPDWQTSVGLAAGFGEGIRLYAARPVGGTRDWVLSMRFSRSF